ncbi:hypothetical protein JCM11251_007666 [Rhodosporidiobolus azoricus]
MSFLSRFTRTKSSSSTASSSNKPYSSSKPAAATTSPIIPLDLPTSTLLQETSSAAPLLLRSPPTLSHIAEGNSPTPSRDEDLRSLRSVDTTPWVEVPAGGDSPRTARARPFPGSGEKDGRRRDPEKERKEWLRVEKARLGVAEVTLVVDECGGVIRSRGLTTLGLFRPYRLAESPSAQLSLILLFLDYCAEFEVKIPAAEGSGIRGSEASKAVLLHAWREELRYAEVVDVVAVVKWALRHLLYPTTTSFSGNPSPSLSFYTSSILPHFSTTPNAFSAHLLPSLPPSSQRLLLSTLALTQHVAAFSSRNAMSARRLCRLLGLYLFGFAPLNSPAPTEDAWEKLYRDWQLAGDVLEGCLRAYLREQSDLPPRLQDLLVDYDDFVARQKRAFAGEGKVEEGGRQVAVVRVELETRGEGWKVAGDAEVNDQITGLSLVTPLPSSPTSSSSTCTPVRRKPLEILLAAFEAGETSSVGEVGDAGKAWRLVLEASKQAEGGEGGVDKVKALVDEETWRVLQLLGLDRAGSSARSTEEEKGSRRRKGSLDRPGASPYGTSGGAQSAGNLLFTNAGPSAKRQVTPSWDSFATSGFSASTAQLSLDAGGGVDEFGLSSRAKGRSSRPSAAAKKPATTKLVSISIHHIDEEFVDVWLDTLVGSRSALSPVAGWPGVVLSPLRSGVVHRLDALDMEEKVDHLFVRERLLPLSEPTNDIAPPAPAGLNRALSSASSRTARTSGHADDTLSPRKRWRRRASAIFSSSSSSSLPTVSSTTRGREASDSSTLTDTTSTSASTSTSAFSSLRPSARRSRKSFTFTASDSAPPVPAVPSLPPLPQSPPTPLERDLESPPSLVEEERKIEVRTGGGGLVRRVSQQARQAVSKRTSRQSLSSSSRPPGRAEKQLTPPVTEAGEKQGESQLYVSEVPLTPGAEVVSPLFPLPAQHVGELEQGTEKERDVEPYQVEQPAEEAKKHEEVEEPERAKEEVLEPLEEMIAAGTAEGEKVDGDGEVKKGFKPALSPFDTESPIDPSSPLAASRSPSFPLPNSPAATSASFTDPIGVDQLEAALVESGEPTPVPPIQGEERPHDEEPSIPALPATIDEPAPTQPEELIAPPPADLPAASTSAVTPDEVVHEHPEQTADVEDVAFAADPFIDEGEGDKPDVLRPATGTADDVKHIEDVACPAIPATADKGKKEEYELDLPAASTSANESTTPTFTLSPPPPEKDLSGAKSDPEKSPEDAVKLDEADEEKPAEAIGLGLENLPAAVPSTVEAAPPATPTKSLPPVPISTSPRTPTSPNLTAETSLSRTLSHGSQTSPIANSPTPSNSSTGSRRFLSNMGSMLRRKKSGIEKEAAKREKEEQKREKEEQKQLRKLREEELKREKKERKIPTPVSNVKARVKEIEAEESATGGSNSPATPAKTRVMSMYGSPAPASPSPAPAGLSRPASMVSLKASRPVSLVAAPQAGLAAQEPSNLFTHPTEAETTAPIVDVAAADPSASAVVDEQPEGAVIGTVEETSSVPVSPEQPLPTTEISPQSVAEEDVTDKFSVVPTVTPAQEPQHLAVKLPASLDNLPSPLPSPSPQPISSAEVAPLACENELTQPIPDVRPPVFVVEPAAGHDSPQQDGEEEPLSRIDGDHTGPIPLTSIASPAPAQESEHLHVKVPSSFENLPSPIPSPTPRDDGIEAEPLADDLTETIPEITRPIFAPSEEKLGEQVQPEGREDVEAFKGAAAPEREDQLSVSALGDVKLTAEDSGLATTLPTSLSRNSLAHVSTIPDFPSTPTKGVPSPTAVDSTPNGHAHSIPVATTQDDVFSSSPAASAATTTAVQATPTKPGPPPVLAQIIRTSPSQNSITTTTSFQTADSSARSSMSEHWEAPDDAF